MNKPGDALLIIQGGGLDVVAREVGKKLAETNDAYGQLSCTLKVIEAQVQSDISAVKHAARVAALTEVREMVARRWLQASTVKTDAGLVSRYELQAVLDALDAMVAKAKP